MSPCFVLYFVLKPPSDSDRQPGLNSLVQANHRDPKLTSVREVKAFSSLMWSVGQSLLLAASISHGGSWPQAGAECWGWAGRENRDSRGLLPPLDFKLGDIHFPYCLSHFDLG